MTDNQGARSAPSTTTATIPGTPPSGLVAAYSMDEGAGASLNDASGNGHSGTITGATWAAAGRFGKALSFNGSSNLVTVADANDLDLTGGMTLSAWVKPSALSGYCTVIMKERQSDLSYALYAHDNAPRSSAYVTTGGALHGVQGVAGLTLSTWTHLAVTYDGATLRLFVNGTQVGSQSVGGTADASTSPLRIGGNAVWGEYFAGLIDEVRIYNRALSAAEIQTDLNTPVASTNPAAPVADFAASTRSGTAPLTTTFSDLSTGEVTGWSWDFGDGTRVATQSPQHTYTAPGTYSVTLTVTGPGGTHSATKTDYVQVLPPAPVADFAASVGSGLAPLTTTFSCKSSGDITARRWDFGDGGTSTAATAVHTYTVPGTYAVSLWVSGPGGEDTEVKSAFITENAPAPVADFTGDVQQGSAPLTVRFHNASTGQFTASAWNFGEGSTSDQSHPTPTYTEPGLYAVTLTVSGGPGGSNTRTRSDYVQVDAAEVPMEVGELLVNDQWQRVDFQTPFTDPIMVASPLSNNDGVPAVVRIYGVDPEGFWIRVQEWGYLDGKHANEAVSYTAIERGRHQLPDGAWVEAGRLAKGTIAFAATTFSEPFAEVPVVFSTVTSVNEADAVVTRMRQISVTGFQVRMWEQEVNKQKHLPESIDYIAWEPSFGVVNGLRYEVGRMGALVSHSVSTLVYQAAFAQPPIFLADMQTTNGGDTANLRWLNRTEVALEVWVSEEQSRDAETAHVAESVGYFAADEAQ